METIKPGDSIIVNSVGDLFADLNSRLFINKKCTIIRKMKSGLFQISLDSDPTQIGEIPKRNIDDYYVLEKLKTKLSDYEGAEAVIKCFIALGLTSVPGQNWLLGNYQITDDEVRKLEEQSFFNYSEIREFFGRK